MPQYPRITSWDIRPVLRKASILSESGSADLQANGATADDFYPPEKVLQ